MSSPSYEALQHELHETRQSLLQAEGRLAKQQEENNALLHGIAILTRSQGIHRLFSNLIDILRPLIGFEHAAVLLASPLTSTLRCEASSHPALAGQVWRSEALFRRVLAGETVALFAPLRVPEFAGCDAAVRELLGSALLTSLNLVQGKLMLLCCHSRPHALDLQARSLLQRYRPLIDQALLNVDYRARLETLVQDKTQALRRSQEYFRRFAEMSSDWFWITGPDNCFIPFNQDLYGGRASSGLMRELAGHRFTDYLTERERNKEEKWRRFHQELAERRPLRAFRFEVLFEGQERWIAINGDPFFAADGHYAGYMGTVNDITRQVRRSEELKRAKRRADTANRAKSQFLAVMSHEIRTPMQAILGMLDLLEQSNLKLEQRELIHHVTHSASLLQTLLNDVLDYSRIEAKAVELESIPFALRFVLQSVIAQMQEQARLKGITLRLELDEQLPVWQLGDPLRLTQILFNLLGNAIKFTSQGGVILGLTCDRDRLLFSVRDTGPGIPPDRCKELFRPFRQLAPSMTRRFGGTGLGLAICRRLVELMAGEIGVDSEPGQGSCFWFVIPLRMPTTAELQRALDQSPIEVPPLDILLVEDSPVNRQVLQAMLTRLGHKVTMAERGSQALALVQLQPQPPDVVLMDLRMPEMDGFETTRHLQASHPELPVLALTADVADEDRARCLKAGMLDLIGKPVTSMRLQQALQLAVMQKKRSTLVG